MRFTINPVLFQLPSPVLRLWTYLAARGGKYTGTPGKLVHDVRGSVTLEGGKGIGKRALPVCLDCLKHFGMAEVNRYGSFLSIELVETES